MCPSLIKSRVSAEVMLNGIFDYNKTPLAPPGARVIVHEASCVRKTWDARGVDVWYIDGALEYYRCHRCYITKKLKRIAHTVEFFPYLYNMPTTNSVDAAQDAVA